MGGRISEVSLKKWGKREFWKELKIGKGSKKGCNFLEVSPF